MKCAESKLLIISQFVFASDIIIQLKNKETYAGCIIKCTSAFVLIESHQKKDSLISIHYEQIESILYEELTQFAPISKNDVIALTGFSSPSDPVTEYISESTKENGIISICYNEFYSSMQKEHLDSINDIEFNMLLNQLNNYMEKQYDAGIIHNPCAAPIFQRLHNTSIASLTNREFLLLMELQKHCHTFQEEVDWDVNICQDPIFKSLLSKNENELTTNEKSYRYALIMNCEELIDDLDNDYASYWKNTSTMLNNDIPIFYDPPVNPKATLLPGGLLSIPGVILRGCNEIT